MKTTLLVACSALILSTCVNAFGASPPPRSTAYYIKSHAQELNGKLHRLRISQVRPGRVEGSDQWFSVCTEGTEGSFGGWIDVLTDEPQRFISRFGYQLRWHSGLAIQHKRLRGVVRISSSGTAYLDATIRTVNLLGAGAGDADKDGDTEEGDPVAPAASARIRTWTSSDGRTVEAEFLSANAVMVKIRRTSDDAVFEFELAKLSQADRDWVAANR